MYSIVLMSTMEPFVGNIVTAGAGFSCLSIAAKSQFGHPRAHETQAKLIYVRTTVLWFGASRTGDIPRTFVCLWVPRITES